jgi:pimeloyl-ACP methyl ester carboxylesterase
MNFDGHMLYQGTFDNVKRFVSSLQRRESSATSAGAGLPFTHEEQTIETINVKHSYAKSGKPHAIAFVTTLSKDALLGRTQKETPKQTRYLFDLNLADGSAINIPAPQELTFKETSVSSVYDPSGIWIAAASSILHVLRLDIGSLTFTADFTINALIPRPQTGQGFMPIAYPTEVIIRDGRPDYLVTSKDGNQYISHLTVSAGNKAHFLVGRNPSLIIHRKGCFGQNLSGKVTVLKTLPGSDFPVPFIEDLTTGTSLPILTPSQLKEVGCDIKDVFLLGELRSYLPESPLIPSIGDNAVLVTTRAVPQTISRIFGGIDPTLKRRIEKLDSLSGEVAVSPKLDAYVHAEESAGGIPRSTIEIHRKDGTSIRYSIAMDAPISPVELCHFRCSYPAPITGIYLRGRQDTGVVFLHIHGGPHAKTSANKFNPFAQYLASFGDVVGVNYPGSTCLGSTYESYSDGNWSGVADLLAEIATPFARMGKKVVAVGTSFGAYAAMKIADKHPDLLAGVIAINGIYNLHDGLKEEATIGGEMHTMEWTHQFGGGDGDEILNQNSVIFGPRPLARVKCPTLLVSGGKDRICLPSQTEGMFAALAPSTPAYHLHSKKMGHSHNGAENVIITSVIGPFLHAHISRRVSFEPFPEATERLAANGADLGGCGLPGWSLRSNTPRREMLDAELTALDAAFH